VGQILEQGPHRRIEGPCHGRFAYFAGDLRRRDVPGMMDALFHVLERSGIVRDDSLIQTAEWHYKLDREGPRVEIELIRREEAQHNEGAD
jgi:Holliday junction resolvase RusA-like endonuclease